MTETSKAVIHQYLDCLERHDVEGAVALLAPTWQIHGLPLCQCWGFPLQRDAWMWALDAVFAGFPDARVVVAETIAEGELVATRHIFSGTHLAAFRGIPPTERKVRVRAMLINRVHDGTIVEAWLNADFLGLLTQIGAIRALGEGDA